jgi:hypothetical protein
MHVLLTVGNTLKTAPSYDGVVTGFCMCSYVIPDRDSYEHTLQCHADLMVVMLLRVQPPVR